VTAKIFIDGEAGTTGLQIRDRLAGRRDLQLLSIDVAKRKDLNERKRLLNSADVAILCLPDAAARESVSLIDNDTTRIIDASTAHRLADGWEYGFPEMELNQSERIANAQRVGNPGCWPQGVIATLRPLISAGLIPADYALTLQHKHLPEMKRFCQLDMTPLFTPAIGNFQQGMLVMIPLQLAALARVPTGAELHEAISDYHAAIADSFVSVAPYGDTDSLNPECCNNSNSMRLNVFANDQTSQVVLMAVYDNLGKGASGAAVQNLNLMLGVAANTSLAA